MPSYDYECKSCGHTFEVFQNMSDPPLNSCPKCRKSVRRLIGGGLGVIFKGSGFYVNDSRKTSSPAPSAAAPGSAAKSTEPKESKESKEPKESKDTKETKKPSETSSSKDKVAV